MSEHLQFAVLRLWSRSLWFSDDLVDGAFGFIGLGLNEGDTASCTRPLLVQLSECHNGFRDNFVHNS
jgi:hypothetical protein